MRGRPARRPSSWTTRIIGFVGFLIVPLVVTAMVPVSWVGLTRGLGGAGRASATVHTCALFVIPYRIQHVADLTGADQSIHRGDLVRRRHGERNAHSGQREEDEGQLILLGGDGEARVPVSPASLERVAGEVNGFVQGEGGPRRRLFTIANWKFGLGAGVPATLLALLYLLGCALALRNRLPGAVQGPRRGAQAARRATAAGDPRN